jgi:hypothetical protein
MRPVDGWQAGADELVQAVSISVMATAATKTTLRPVCQSRISLDYSRDSDMRLPISA